MVRYGMVIDLNRCIGCRSCAVICKIHNSLPPGTWWHRVETVGSREHHVSVGKFPDLSEVYLPVPCMHCDNPPCVKVCPVGATWKREDGVVLVDFERCIGCRYCMTACPYGVRQFNWEDKEKAIEKGFRTAGFDGEYVDGYRHGYPLDHRTKDGRLVYTPERPRGVVEKCTFCVQYIDQGLKPACVRGCPGNARIFGDLDDPNSEISKVLRDKAYIRLLEDVGTEPKVFYILPVRKKGRGIISYSTKLGVKG
jgi:molybdopterin-containing oxidoreductase family iron-sulfur binding subunit